VISSWPRYAAAIVSSAFDRDPASLDSSLDPLPSHRALERSKGSGHLENELAHRHRDTPLTGVEKAGAGGVAELEL
jgi:hypothetical protein